MVGAILFDLDGTLVDSVDDIALALDAALRDHGVAVPPRARVRDAIGGGARMLVARFVEPALVDAVLAGWRGHYAAAPVAHTRIYDGLAPVLDELAAAGLPLAVLTNKPQELADPICARLLGAWPFVAIVGAREGVPTKPDPAPALAIARELGLPPDRCVVVGDAPTDIATAHAAGMRSVAVSWGYRPRGELEAARPWLLVDEPAGLRALLR